VFKTVSCQYVLCVINVTFVSHTDQYIVSCRLQTYSVSVKSFIRLTRRTTLIYSKTTKKHTVYQRFGFTSEAFIDRHQKLVQLKASDVKPKRL